MKLAISAAVCLLAAALPSTGSAQVYQWKDSSGRTIISDTPPPSTTKGTRSVGGSPAPSTEAPAAGSAAAAPKTAAEKEMEFRKRQQEAREKADKEAKEQAAAAERKDNCERARRQLAALESGQGFVTHDDKGERHVMQAAERQQEIERMQRFMADACK